MCVWCLESSKLTAGKLHDTPVGDELCLKQYIGTFGSGSFLLAETLGQGNPDRNHKFSNIESTER
jgi:hypothetical protein